LLQALALIKRRLQIVCPACNHRIDLNAPYRAMRSLRRETGR